MCVVYACVRVRLYVCLHGCQNVGLWGRLWCVCLCSQIYDPLMSMSMPFLQSPDPRSRYGVLALLLALSEGCCIRMKHDLPALVSSLLPLVSV